MAEKSDYKEDIERAVAVFETSLGDFEAELYAKECPETVWNFINLVEGRQVLDKVSQGGRDESGDDKTQTLFNPDADHDQQHPDGDRGQPPMDSPAERAHCRKLPKLPRSTASAGQDGWCLDCGNRSGRSELRPSLRTVGPRFVPR